MLATESAATRLVLASKGLRAVGVMSGDMGLQVVGSGKR